MSGPAGKKARAADAPAPDVVVPLSLSQFREGGHDELSVARLSLISAQLRVPTDSISWTQAN